uniref:Interleukin n=1 Tax=Sinocyclocheilus anshuiensis TaxID=1608454 RepID=A0A671QPM7_9TELE
LMKNGHFCLYLLNICVCVLLQRTRRCACNPWCFENHMECLLNSEVWNSILILSCLSALLPVAEGHAMQALKDLQNALRDKETKLLFQRSNASLYTPNTDDIENCTFKFFDCFLMEMNVLLHEEDPFVFGLLPQKCSERYPCELLELTNPREFFDRMTNFLEKQYALCSQPSTITCD